MFKECLKEVGVDHKLYGLHSLRSGGATSDVSFDIIIFQKGYSSSTDGGSQVLRKICISSKMFLCVYK